ncbi:MAG: PGPGW domain-containing protein [Actinomycetota bacterium]
MRDETRELPANRTQQLPRTIAIRQTRRIAVGVVGGVFVALGIVLIPLPGPGSLLILLGLTILSWEFRWAKRLLFEAKRRWRELKARRRARAP